MSRQWYFFNPVGGGDETDPTQYSLSGSVWNCSCGQDLCAVYVHGGTFPERPLASDISPTSTIFNYIAASRILGGVPYPQSPPDEPFVFMRDLI